MKNYLKSIIVGVGGVAPGLSGSVLLIIFGLYRDTLDALGTLPVRFKKNIKFLLPVVAGMFTGVLLFSKVIDFCLNTFEMQTRFCFLGLILGTVPLLFKEVKKEGFCKKYYILILASAVVGTCIFTVNTGSFPQIDDPNLIQSVLLGVAVAATAIIPGVDPAVLLSTLGLYEAYVRALADVDLRVLLPLVVGLAAGSVMISFGMSMLLKRFYTVTYTIIFGIFLSMIPNMLNDSCIIGFNIKTLISFVVMVLGFVISYYIGNINTESKDEV